MSTYLSTSSELQLTHISVDSFENDLTDSFLTILLLFCGRLFYFPFGKANGKIERQESSKNFVWK